MTEYTLVVNAGGASTRMSAGHKALLPVPPRGMPLVNHIIDTLSPLTTCGTVVVANDVSVADAVTLGSPDATMASDLWAGAGPMAGIATGLAHSEEWAIVVACDMPFVNPTLFRLLCEMALEEDADSGRRWDVVVPRVRAYPQMLHALYHRDILPVFEEMIQDGNVKLLGVLPRVRVRYATESEMAAADPEMRSFTNVNTDEDWASALNQLQKPNSPLS